MDKSFKRMINVLWKNEDNSPGLKRFFETLECGVWEWNFKTNELQFTPYCEKILGLSGNELPREYSSLRDRIHPDDMENTQANIREVVEGRRPTGSHQFRLLHEDGGYVWVQESFTSSDWDKNDKVINITGILRDITDMKNVELKAEAEIYHLEQSESVFGVGTWNWDVPSNHLRFSQNCGAMLNRTVDELNGPLEKEQNFMEKESYKSMNAKYKEWFAQGGNGTLTQEIQTIDSDGQMQWFLESANVVERDSKGNIIFIRGMWQNINETIEMRKKIEEQNEILKSNVESAEKVSEAMFEANPQINLLSTAEGTVIGCNPAAVKFFRKKNKKSLLAWLNNYEKHKGDAYGHIIAPGGNENLPKYFKEATEKGRCEFATQFKNKPVMNVLIKRIEYGDSFAFVSYLSERPEADERMQNMFDAMPLTCLLLDDKLKVIDCNAAAVRISQDPDKETYIREYKGQYPEYQPDGVRSKDRLQEEYGKAINEGIAEFPWTIKLKDGTLSTCDATVVRVNKGDTYQLAVFADSQLDLTREKQRSQESEAYMQMMFDSTPLICSIRDDQGNILDCNQKALELLELDNKEAYINSFLNMSPEYQPDGSSSAEMAAEHIADAGELGYKRFKWVYQTSSGEPLPVETMLIRTPWKDSYRILAYSRDLREILAEQGKAKEAEAYGQMMLDSTPLICSVWDENNNMVDCNMEALKRFGIDTKEEYIEHFLDLSAPVQPNGEPSEKMAAEYIAKTVETGYQQFYWDYHAASGEPLPVETTLIKTPWKGSYRILAYSRDLREIEAERTKAKEAEAYTQMMLDSTPLICSIWDENVNIIDCNMEAVKIFGLSSKEEFISKIHELEPQTQNNGESSEELRIKYISEVIENEYANFRWDYLSSDGEVLPTDTTLFFTPWKDGHRILAYSRDLREILAEQESTRKAVEYASLMLDSTPLICTVRDEEGKVIDCNMEAMKLFEVDSKKEYIDNYNEFHAPIQDGNVPYEKKVEDILDELTNTNYVKFPWQYITSSGEPLPVEMTMIRVPWNDSFRILSYSRDLREFNAEQAKAQEAEAYTQMMLDSTPLVCAIWNEDLELIDCNNAVVRLFGLDDKSEYINNFHKFNTAFQPGDVSSKEKAENHIKKALETGYQQFDWEYLIPATDERVPANITLIRVPYQSGYRVVAYSQDLREINAATESVERYTNLLHKINEVAENLIVSDPENYSQLISDQIKLLGKTLGADVCRIWEAYTLDGELYFKQTYSWVNQAYFIGKEWSEPIHSCDLPFVTKMMKNGEAVNCAISALPAKDSALLSSFDIKAMLLEPVLMRDGLWGMVSYENFINEETLPDMYVDVLKSCGILMASSISRNKAGTALITTKDDLSKSGRLMEVVNDVAKLLMDDSGIDVTTTVQESLCILGISVGSYRASIWKNFEDENGVLCARRYPFWVDGLAFSETSEEFIMDIPSYIPEWNKDILERKDVNLPVKHLSDAHRAYVKDPVSKSLLLIHLEVNGEYWGHIGFAHPEEDHLFSEAEIGSLRSGGMLIAEAIMRAEMNKNLIMAKDDLTMRSRLLEAVNHVAKLLMDSNDHNVTRTVQESLQILGESVGADRVSIWRNFENEDGLLCASRLPGWIEGQSFEESSKEAIIDIASYVPEWDKGATEREDINLPIREMNKTLRNFAILQESKSLLLLYVDIDGEFWGFVGFANSNESRIYSEAETSILRSGSMMIAEAVIRNEVNEQLVVAMEDALASVKAKNEFLARMSHEIRTPLNAVIGMTSVAQSSDDTEKVEECLDIVTNSSKRLLSIINNVLDMSNIDLDELSVNVRDFDFENMLKQTIDSLRADSDEKEQQLIVDFKNPFKRMVQSDEHRISQVLLNLMGNAIKFTPEKGVITLKINEIPKDENTSELLIEVCDTGIGIEEGLIDIIFDPFEQADGSMTRSYGGVGLGLPLCKSIVTKMGGNIEVESQVGAGSTFTFTLPVTWGAKCENHTYPSTIKRDVRILVVDDMPDVLSYLESIFEGFSVDCDTAVTPQDAIKKFDAAQKDGRPYEIVFLDWFLYDQKADKIANRMQKAKMPPEIVLMSVADWESIEKEAKKTDINRFLQKPLMPSTLIDMVIKILEEQNHDAAEKEDSKPLSGSTVWPDKTLLLVEDIEINRMIAMELLSSTEIQIECAEDGEQAVQMYSNDSKKYDLILMDLQMPIVDGYEATRKIRNLNLPGAKDIPIFAMTAHTYAEDIEACLEAGMNGHLSKPIDYSVLISTLEKVFST